ncbi:Chaperone protein dnaJ 11, chloroplastic [Stylosanthes scabra]|uniref:Chaperone protein dnaJ 11, chloroplastic n=1 Tax=Stylosanthes scabra TaxID=79078 RepID=A0ABU6UBI2_9FABA|nr:Chaperone protein dnaJ 11, chloroplastic [Stylosanthes scabra]
MLSSSFSSPLAANLSSSPRHLRSRPTLSAGASTPPAPDHQRSSTFSLSSTASFYDILGIPASASILEIKAAYRRLARICHPDAAAVTANRSGSSSADEFMKLHAAYSTLSDPEKRASYDRSLHQRRQVPLTAATTESRFSGYGGRRWETDQCW